MGAIAMGVLAHGVGEAAAGLGGLPPFGPTTALTVWRLDVAAAVGLLVCASLYTWGVERLRRRGRAWSPWRSASFLTGIATLALATQSSMGAYDDSLFSVHVAQHLVLSMVGPFFLALGAPVTLALQASTRSTQTRLLGVLHSRPVTMLTHPAVAFTVFALTLYGLYFTPLYALSLRNDVVHSAVHLHFAVAGSLFFWVVVGLDPVGSRLPYGARLVMVLATVPVHAFLGIALMTGTHPLAADWYAQIRQWGVSPLTDQRTGGALMWGFGDLLSLAAGAVVVRQWTAHEDRATERQRRRSSRSGTHAPVGPPAMATRATGSVSGGALG
jgi:putative copper resistance protein D